ncbi:MAG: hypothetical protein SF162_04890 [bacterium]|nr:hypothetical protein [bacterium]
MSQRKFVIDPDKPFFIYNTAGDWLATKMGIYLFDTRGDYIGFVLNDVHDVYTASGEWIGNLYPDGRIVRKRNYDRLPLLKKLPPKPTKPAKMPVRAPLQQLPADLGFDKIDVLEWDEEVFKRLSDLIPDAGEE